MDKRLEIGMGIVEVGSYESGLGLRVREFKTGFRVRGGWGGRVFLYQAMDVLVVCS